MLVVVPVARLETVWRGLTHRLAKANVPISHRNPSVNVPHVVAADAGPVLAITSWAKVLSAIEAELVDESQRNDLLQLRALCDAADLGAATPFSSTLPTFLGRLVEGRGGFDG